MVVDGSLAESGDCVADGVDAVGGFAGDECSGWPRPTVAIGVESDSEEDGEWWAFEFV